MTVPYWLSEGTSKESACDVLIIGAGFAGLSTAYWLTEFSQDLKITIIDRSFSGAGASGRNAGFLTKGSAAFYQTLTTKWGNEGAKSIYDFAEQSISETFNRFGKNLSFEKTESMTLFRNLDHWAEKALMFNFSWIDKQELPIILQKHFAGAYKSSPEYKINPIELLNEMKSELLARKVTLIEGLSSFSLTSTGAETEKGAIKAQKVILAMNAFLPQFHLSFKDVVTPRRAQMLAVETKEELDCPSLYYDPDNRVYFRKEKGNVLLIGGKRLLDEKGETGDFEKLSPLIQGALEDYLRSHLGLHFQVLKRWSGIMGFTEHELPIIQKIKAPVETYMLGGFSGHGVGLGFLAGKEAAELAIGKKTYSLFSKFKKIEISL